MVRFERIARGFEMHELTGYFPTTDRTHAAESLASFRSQGIPRPIVVIRNVRPLRAAHLPTLECETSYSIVVDDDVILRPGVAQQLIDRFRELRETRPRGFKLNARVYCEAKEAWGRGGIKLFHTPHLREVGWPDAPHVSAAQKRIAEELGFEALECDIEAGVQKRGTDLDGYKKYLWIQWRARAGQHKGVNARRMVKRALETGDRWRWFAALGAVDGSEGDLESTSKDEDSLGPIGRTLDLDAVSVDEIRRILADHGLAEAATGASPARGRRLFLGLGRRPRR
jgi:hypothetical protein